MKEKQEGKDIQQNIGYGHGTTIGFTEDGKVFMVQDTQGPEGQPMQAMFTYDPERAIEMASSFVKAAETAKKQVKKNVGLNSNRPN